MARFRNRTSAGQELLQKLTKFKNNTNTVVVGLPRGGMLTAFEIAKGLGLPLAFLVVKKIGAPGNPELAVGAVADDGTKYIDSEIVSSMNVSEKYINDQTEKKIEEAKDRARKYLRCYKNPKLSGKTVILTDDGIATGATMTAAIKALEERGVLKIIVSVPAGPGDNFKEIRKRVDDIVCVDEDLILFSVGEYYDEFPEITDEEVVKILLATRAIKNAKNIHTK